MCFNQFLGKMRTRPLKLKPPICYISSSKIIHLMMATNAAGHLVLFGYYKKQAIILGKK